MSYNFNPNRTVMPFTQESHLYCRKQKPQMLETLYKSQPENLKTNPVFILGLYFSFVLIDIINNELTSLYHPILNIFNLFLLHLVGFFYLNRKVLCKSNFYLALTNYIKIPTICLSSTDNRRVKQPRGQLFESTGINCLQQLPLHKGPEGNTSPNEGSLLQLALS